MFKERCLLWLINWKSVKFRGKFTHWRVGKIYVGDRVLTWYTDYFYWRWNSDIDGYCAVMLQSSKYISTVLCESICSWLSLLSFGASSHFLFASFISATRTQGKNVYVCSSKPPSRKCESPAITEVKFCRKEIANFLKNGSCILCIVLQLIWYQQVNLEACWKCIVSYS